MKKLKPFLLGICLIVNYAFADTGINNLNYLLQSFQSLSANFQENISDSSGGFASQQNGHLLIKKPNQFRWEVTDPNEQLFISDGKTLWNIEPDLDQATVSALTQNLSTTPLLLLSGTVTDINRVFKVTQIGANQYRLIPSDNDSLIKEVDLVFNQNIISRISVVNTMGQIAVVSFTDVQFNVNISAQQFNYTPSAGMQVLHQ